MTQITTKKYPVNGISINVAEVGKGEPIVLVHGWSNNWTGWTPLAKKLASHYKLYMLDLPGFGDSDRLEKYSIDIVAKYINGFITSNSIKPKAIIGASLGTLISAYTLKKYPKLSDNLIELGAVFNGQLSLKSASKLLLNTLNLAGKTEPTSKIVSRTIKLRYTAYLVEKFLQAYKFDKKKVDKYMIPGRQKITGKSYIQLGLSASKFNLKRYIETTEKKVLLIYGEAEKYVKLDEVQKLVDSKKTSNINMVVIKKSGHNPAYERPSQTSQIIVDFLKLH